MEVYQPFGDLWTRTRGLGTRALKPAMAPTERASGGVSMRMRRRHIAAVERCHPEHYNNNASPPPIQSGVLLQALHLQNRDAVTAKESQPRLVEISVSEQVLLSAEWNWDLLVHGKSHPTRKNFLPSIVSTRREVSGNLMELVKRHPCISAVHLDRAPQRSINTPCANRKLFSLYSLQYVVVSC